MFRQLRWKSWPKLGNNEVMGAVDQAVGEALTYYLEEPPKEAKLIVDKVILAAQARIAARKARESVQRDRKSTRLNSSHSDRSRMPSSA